ncbi:MAG: hypothetical protein JW891_09315 [Candidatus Lokiarchaeota archaeon]|nr:hypothetical protein [Candidatus Lokiarchaeota archaeon]
MAKKKKKDKKKKEKKLQEEESASDDEASEAQSLPTIQLDKALLEQMEESEEIDVALESAKETQEDLQGLLSNISKGDGFFRSQIKVEIKEEQVKPQLSYNRQESNLVNDFLIEDVPLTERKISRSEIKNRTRLVDSSIEKKPLYEPPPKPPVKIGIPKAVPAKEPPLDGVSEENNEVLEDVEEQMEPKPIIEEVQKPIKENIYPKLEAFFTELIEGYGSRYKIWEDSISSVLSVLRKMRKVTKTNTEDLVKSINQSYEKIQKGLSQFAIKRTEIEKIAEIDIESLSKQFKKVLGMLELQVKEYQLKRLADEYIHEL